MITPDDLLKYPLLCYPVGAGGNWLRRVLLDEPLPSGAQNFHRDINGDIGPCTTLNNSTPGIILTHNTEHNWRWIFSGQHRFNFYLNRLYKTEHLEKNIFVNKPAQMSGACIEIAKRVCTFDAPTPWFDFEDLLSDPDKFLLHVNQARDEIDVSALSLGQFLASRDAFLSTCVDTQELYENWDNPYWTLFVVAQLECQGILPNCKFEDPTIRQFAQHNYQHCAAIPVHHFNNRVTMPEWRNQG